MSRKGSLSHLGVDTNRVPFQVTVVAGPSQDIIPQLKMKYDVDMLDMVFLDHWKDRYLPDTLLLEVSSAPTWSTWASVLVAGAGAAPGGPGGTGDLGRPT